MAEIYSTKLVKENQIHGVFNTKQLEIEMSSIQNTNTNEKARIRSDTDPHN
jgi:hypothetical protein